MLKQKRDDAELSDCTFEPMICSKMVADKKKKEA
jgi:hypothetical protein